MTYLVTVKEKGQVTIPAEIRRLLAIRSGDKIAFISKDKQVMILPTKSFIDLKGSVKSPVVYTDLDADKTVSRFIKKS